MDERRITLLRWIAGGLAGLIGLTTFAYAYWRDDVAKAALDPGQPFQTYQPPAAPDYAAPTGWFLHPAAAPGAFPADIFFVHSTTFDGGRDWVGRIDDPSASRAALESSIPNYAGPFGGLGRVFAPRYRQASLYAYRLTLREDAREARAFAYGDVARAFQAFRAQASPSGPIILAGVGQGAQIVDRLARDAASDPALRRRIAAVYLMEEITPDSDFPPGGPLPLCERRDQARCVIAWISLDNSGPDREKLLGRAMSWTPQGDLDRPAELRPACVNPLTGARDDANGSAQMNLGAANATGLKWGEKPALLPHQVEARCDNGFLRVSTPENPGLRKSGGWAAKLQAPRFNLFYADIEADARARLSAWYGGPLASPITQQVEIRNAPVRRISDR